MADEIRARLVYDVSAAQAAVRGIGADLDRLEKPITLSIVVNDAQLTEAVANVQLLKEEVANLAGAIALDDSALAVADEELAAINSELGDLTGTVAVDDSELATAETEVEDLTSSLDALSGVEVGVAGLDGVAADASAAATELDSVGAAADSAAVDMNAVSASVTDTASGLLNVGAAAGAATGDLGSVSGITDSLAGAFEVATGAATGLAETVSADLGPALGAIGVGVGALAASFGAIGVFTDKVVEKATAATSASERFNLILGDQADAVSQVDLAGFDESLSTLVNRLGSGTAAVREADASIFELGKTTGASGDQVALTVEQINLLATRAVALKPSLGDVGDVADRMQSALARGGRFAANFGLALSSTEINARAAELALARGSDQVEQFDKIAAGAALSTEKLGGALKSDIEAGADNVAFSFKRLQLEFSKALTEIGKPLISPAIDLLTAAIPVGVDFAKTFGAAAQAILPAVTSITSALEPLIKIFTDEFAAVLVELAPDIKAVGDELAASLSDPRTVQTMRDLAKSTGDLLIAIGPLLPLLLDIGPILQYTVNPPLEAFAQALEDTDRLLQPLFLGISVGLRNLGIEIGPPLDETKEAAHGVAIGLGEIALEADKLSTVGGENGFTGIIEDALISVRDRAEEAADQLREDRDAAEEMKNKMDVARGSVDALAKAIKEGFDKPTTFDLAVAQADFEKAKADAQKSILELVNNPKLTGTERLSGGLDIVSSLTNQFGDLLSEQEKLGKLTPEQLAASRDSFKQMADNLLLQFGAPQATIDAFNKGLDDATDPKKIDIQVDTDTAGTKLDGLRNKLLVLTTDVAEPKIQVDDDEANDDLDGIHDKLAAIDETSVEPTVGLNDQISGALSGINVSLALIDVTDVTPTVTLDDQATPGLNALATKLGGIHDLVLGIGLGIGGGIGGIIAGFEDGGIVDSPTLAVMGERNKRELVLPLEGPWDRQMDLLDQSGVLARLEAQFTEEEQTRAASVNRALAWRAPVGTAGPSTADLDAIATRMENAARLAAAESRPIHAPITVPSLRDEHETARILRRKLVRL